MYFLLKTLTRTSGTVVWCAIRKFWCPVTGLIFPFKQRLARDAEPPKESYMYFKRVFLRAQEGDALSTFAKCKFRFRAKRRRQFVVCLWKSLLSAACRSITRHRHWNWTSRAVRCLVKFRTPSHWNYKSSSSRYLSNTGSGALGVAGISSSPNFFQTSSTCGKSLAVGASCSFSVRSSAILAGILSGTVTVSDDSAGGPHLMTLSGIGQ